MTIIDEFKEMVAEMAAEDLFPAILIRKGGKEATKDFDPVEGTVEAGGTSGTSIPCRALADKIETTAQDGTTLTQTIITLTVEPHEGDTLKLGENTYQLTEPSQEAPSGVAIIFYAKAAR